MPDEAKPTTPKSDLEIYLSSKKKRRRYFLTGALIGVVVTAAAVIAVKQFSLPAAEELGFVQADTEDPCNVLGINLHGDLLTYLAPQDSNGSVDSQDQTASENVVYAIDSAEAESAIKAVILEIDSYGGYPVAGEEVAAALRRAKKPTVAVIRNAAASAAYLAATGAKTIFASKYSDVGSIGVSMSYTDNVLKNLKEGVTYHSLSTGKFKDTTDPNKPLTAEERALLMRDLEIMHRGFIQDVATNRGLDIAVVTKLADGSTMLGEAALKNGLIDRIGGYEDAKTFLEKQIGEKPEVCWQ